MRAEAWTNKIIGGGENGLERGWDKWMELVCGLSHIESSGIEGMGLTGCSMDICGGFCI